MPDNTRDLVINTAMCNMTTTQDKIQAQITCSVRFMGQTERGPHTTSIYHRYDALRPRKMSPAFVCFLCVLMATIISISIVKCHSQTLMAQSSNYSHLDKNETAQQQQRNNTTPTITSTIEENKSTSRTMRSTETTKQQQAAKGPRLLGPDADVDNYDAHNRTSFHQSVPIGRQATFKCVVEAMGAHKLSWVHVETHTVLASHDKVITSNTRLRVSSLGPSVYLLYIDDVQPSDKGHIMCQLNTIPMKTFTHELEVVEPPRLIESIPASPPAEEQREGQSGWLRCAATGVPMPDIKWRREVAPASGKGRQPTIEPVQESRRSSSIATVINQGQLTKSNGADNMTFSSAHQNNRSISNSIGSNSTASRSNYSENEYDRIVTMRGQFLNISHVTRRDMGYYLCIASNGIKPSLSHRMFLPVSFKPTVTPIGRPQKSKAQSKSQDVILNCDLESYPKAQTQWSFNGQPIISSSSGHYRLIKDFTNVGANKYELNVDENVDQLVYKSIMRLKIKDFHYSDYGVYTCSAKNKLGESLAKINVSPRDYTHLPNPERDLTQMTNVKANPNGKFTPTGSTRQDNSNSIEKVAFVTAGPATISAGNRRHSATSPTNRGRFHESLTADDNTHHLDMKIDLDEDGRVAEAASSNGANSFSCNLIPFDGCPALAATFFAYIISFSYWYQIWAHE